MRALASAALATFSLATCMTVSAQLPRGLPSEQAVAVLMPGPSSSSGERTGMTTLDETLENAFPATLRSRVFNRFANPVDFVRDVSEVTLEDQKVILVGHSGGGREALRFARQGLRDARIRVDLLVQIDRAASVARVPTNVRNAYHFWDPPQVSRDIVGGRDVNVSALFDDDEIEHTSIDDDPRLHAMIVWLANQSFRPNRVNLQMRESPRRRRYEGEFLQAVTAAGDWPQICYAARETLTVAGPLERDISSVQAGTPSTFIVFSGTSVSLRAGHEIVLRPGFSAFPGSEVTIRAGSDCPR